jgi:protein SCO1/2
MGILRFAIALFLLVVPVSAQERFDAEIAYRKSQAAVGQQTGNYDLVDHRGRLLSLSRFRGQPLVVSLVFTSCATVCPISTDHLRAAVLDVRQSLGDESFAVLTFGFDASGDRPAQLSAFAGTHQLSSAPNWFIASADDTTASRFLAELGFSYREATGGFDHVVQTTILDAQGRVHRQVYGDSFPLPVLMEPLKELVYGSTTRSMAPADLWDRINFLCTVYNPLTGAYRFDYSIFFGIFFGGLSLILTGLIILRLWLERRRALRGASGNGDGFAR